MMSYITYKEERERELKISLPKQSNSLENVKPIENLYIAFYRKLGNEEKPLKVPMKRNFLLAYLKEISK